MQDGRERISNPALDQVIDNGKLRIVFQPIVDGRSRQAVGFEALARCPKRLFPGPQDLFAAAAQAGRVGELGRRARELAIKDCPDCALFLNVAPNELDDAWLVRPDDPVFRHRHDIYIEIVESAPLKYFEQCHSVLAELRKKGVCLAIDDFGAGYSNVKYIADLEPDLVKLDRDLVAGIDLDERQFRLVRSLVRLCNDLGAEVVAEGVETEGEFAAVVRAGARYCQGYFFCAPIPASPRMATSRF